MIFWASASQEKSPVLEGQGIVMRLPVLDDFQQWSDLRHQSQIFLQPWEPVWTENELTKSSFRRRVKFYEKQRLEGGSFCFLIFDGKTGSLVGGLNMTQVRRGVIQSCVLGYWIGECYASQGYMTRAVRLVCDFAFDAQGLHRVEAACLLDNIASVKLLRKTGFVFEGLARQYLKINGIWQDHFLFAKIKDENQK